MPNHYDQDIDPVKVDHAELLKKKYNNNFNVRDDLKHLSVEDIRAQRTTKGFAVATFNLKGDLNLGSIMRTAEITGARDFFILGHRQWDRRCAGVVQNYLNFEKLDECVDWGTTCDLVIAKDYSPIVIEQGGMILGEWIDVFNKSSLTVSWEAYPPCFIFGPEDTGFPKDFPAHISLPQVGVSRSYNVSAAAAIVLHAWSFR